jgi:hypothetical protein
VSQNPVPKAGSENRAPSGSTPSWDEVIYVGSHDDFLGAARLCRELGDEEMADLALAVPGNPSLYMRFFDMARLRRSSSETA